MPKLDIGFVKGLVQETGTGIYLSINPTVTSANAAGGTNPVIPADHIVQQVDSGGDTNQAKMPLASEAGQLLIVLNVDSGQDAVIRNNGDSATLATIGEGVGAMFISTAAGDNWKCTSLGS